MRTSHFLGVFVNGDVAFDPDPSTVSSGFGGQYWASSSNTSDKWHNINNVGVPFKSDYFYFGRNSGGVYHNAAVAFKTGSFTGKGKHFTLRLRSTSNWAWAAAGSFLWQLSKHTWSTQAAWTAGSKSYYSKTIGNSFPADPNAVAHGSFTVNNTSSLYFTISGDAEFLPNTEYVFYLWISGTTKGHLVELQKVSSTSPTLTITG